MSRTASSAIALAACVAGLVAATPANAHGVVTFVCTFTGNGTPTPATPWVGGGGTFTFDGSADCVVEHSGIPDTTTTIYSAETGNQLRLQASGTYSTIACGAGNAVFSQASFQDTSNGQYIAAARFETDYVGGAGAILIDEFKGLGPYSGHDAQPGGAGALDIVPAPLPLSGPLSGQPCATGFTANGSFAAVA